MANNAKKPKLPKLPKECILSILRGAESSHYQVVLDKMSETEIAEIAQILRGLADQMDPEPDPEPVYIGSGWSPPPS